VTLPTFTGYIYDAVNMNPLEVKYPGLVGYTPKYLFTNDYTNVLIDEKGNIIELNTEPTPLQLQNYIFLCKVNHPNGVITGVVPKFDSVINNSGTIGELITFLDPIIKGCRVYYNGSNLSINRQSGQVLLKNTDGGGALNVMNVSEAKAYEFTYLTTLNETKLVTTSIDPNQYDNAGILMPVPPGAYTIQRIGITFDQKHVVQYGITTYPSMSAAISGLAGADENFPPYAQLADGVSFAYLIVRQGCTNLSNSTQAQIYQTNVFGKMSLSSSNALIPANNLSDLEDVAVARSNLGAGSPGGLATLDAKGKIPAVQRPFSTILCGSIPTHIIRDTGYRKILETMMNEDVVDNADTIRIQFIADIGNRGLTYKFQNDTDDVVLNSSTINASGIINATFAKPSGSAILSFSVSKTADGGDDPMIKSVIITYEQLL
jgi:hypothetical protein